MKNRCNGLWNVDVSWTDADGYQKKFSLWILANSYRTAIAKGERFAKREFSPRARIKRVEDRGTIDVF